MRKFTFHVSDTTTKEQLLKAARILNCDIEIYCDHELTEFRATEPEELRLDAGTINRI